MRAFILSALSFSAIELNQVYSKFCVAHFPRGLSLNMNEEQKTFVKGDFKSVKVFLNQHTALDLDTRDKKFK